MGSRWCLKGTTSLFSGGTKGIGFAIVEELATLGATIYTCSRNEVEVNKCLHAWKEKGFQVYGSACDVSSRAEQEKLMLEVSSVLNGKLNILASEQCCNSRAEEYSCIMSTNLGSAYHLSQLAHPLLKNSGAGSIIFMSADAGVTSLDVGSIYSLTKGAMVQLGKNLACEWAKDNKRANCVAPWFIITPLNEDV